MAPNNATVTTKMSTIVKARNYITALRVSAKAVAFVAIVAATGVAVVGVVVATGAIVTHGATTGAAAYVATTGVAKVGCVLNVGLFLMFFP